MRFAANAEIAEAMATRHRPIDAIRWAVVLATYQTHLLGDLSHSLDAQLAEVEAEQGMIDVWISVVV